MLTIEITNDGKHPRRPKFGSYDYTVRVNGKPVASGRIAEHCRTDRWPSLLKQLADDAERKVFVEIAEALTK